MKKIYALILLCASGISLSAQTYFQNIYADSIYGESSMCVSPDAYYLLQTGAPPAFTPKMIKVDLNGNKLWSKTFTLNGNSVGVMNIQYQNNALLLVGAYQNAGYFNFVSKLDTAGNVLWSQQINYGDININTDIIPLATGFLLCGHRDILQGSSYTFDITLARYDDGGNLVWAIAHGNSSFDFVCSATATAPNGDIMVAGNYGLRTTLDYDPMLARFDSSGNLIWIKYFYDPSGFFTDFIPTDMCATSDGNFAITGFSNNTNNNYDPHVIIIDSSGNILWAKRLYQISWQEYGNSIICNSQNEIVAAGHYFFGFDHGNFLARFDLAGNYLGALQVKNTYRNHTASFMNIYDSHGNDLYERPGYGYAYSTCFYHDYNHHSQCLVTLDYAGNLNCSSLVGVYPFSVSNITWSFTASISSTSQTGITSTAVTIVSSSISELQTDICSLVGFEEAQTNDIMLYVYPSPASDEIFLYGNSLLEGNVRAIDLHGKTVYKAECKHDRELKIDISEWNQGIYFLELNVKDKWSRVKFFKTGKH